MTHPSESSSNMVLNDLFEVSEIVLLLLVDN
jgi:hypothetical protein